MKKSYLTGFMVLSVLMGGCYEKQKPTEPDYSKLLSDPNTVRLFRYSSNPLEAIVLSLPPVGISLWSDKYHNEYHRFPESREQLKAYIDSHPNDEPPVFWECVEDLSFGDPDSEKLNLTCTLILKDKDGTVTKMPFSSPGKFDSNSLSSREKEQIWKMLETGKKSKFRTSCALKDG